jgi:multicomponent Na+:H+ antiporter subunit B
VRSDRDGLSVIVQVVARWTLVLIVVYGLGVAFFGHLTPGGGFAGGVVVACGFVLATLAFGGRAGPAAAFHRRVAPLEATGALVYLGMAAIGWAVGSFMQAWTPRGADFTLASAPFLVTLNLAILLKVGAGLFAGFMVLVAFDRADPGRRAAGGGGKGEA